MEFGLIAATAADWPIVGQIAWVFGKLMDAIYNFLNLFGIQNIGICIILFTIIIYTLMIPLTIKQQKFSKMQSVMMPEIQKLQKKYAGKRDQASMLKMQEEQQLILRKIRKFSDRRMSADGDPASDFVRIVSCYSGSTEICKWY